MVDHSILLQKLEIYGLEDTALQWMSSYLVWRRRSQSVYVDGCLSPALAQYLVIYCISYIPIICPAWSTIHNHFSVYKAPEIFCDDYGGLVCYVDDRTYSASRKDPDIVSEVLTTQNKTISNYMMSNRLVLNDDKTKNSMVGRKYTSLAAKGALAHRLQRCTACKIRNGHQGAPKWQRGSGKVSTPRFLGVPVNFR